MLTIAQFSNRTGISASALRFYERKRLLAPARRLENGYRVYTLAQVPIARFINSLREADVPITEIRAFLAVHGAKREALLARWQEEVASRLLSLRVASQYLHGLRHEEPPIHLERWDEPCQLVWVPVSAAPGPLPFLDAVTGHKRQLERAGYTILTSGYARTLELRDGRLLGELGFRVTPRRRTMAGARVQEVSSALFATLENTTHDETSAHRVFRFLDQFGFRPTGLHLERYLPGAADRYLLMVAVAPA